jgi:hypothetical protein
LKNYYPLFLEKYQNLYKALLAQSLPFIEFYHRLKYLHNLQSHPVYYCVNTNSMVTTFAEITFIIMICNEAVCEM